MGKILIMELTPLYIISQVAGLFGILLSVLIYQQRTHKAMLILKMLSDIMWLVQYLLLGGYTGVAVTCIALCRSTVFYFYEKKVRTAPKPWLIAFILAAIVSAVFTWKNFLSIFPTVGSIIAVISFWQRKPKNTVYFSYAVSAFMLVYHVFATHSISATVNEILSVTSSTAALIRSKIEKNKEQKETENVLPQ